MVQNSHQNSQCEETTGSHNEQQCSRECFGQNCYVEQCAAADEFTHQTQTAQSDGETKTHTDTIECGSNGTIFGSECFGTRQNQTVYYDQWNVQTQGCVQCRQISLQQELDDCYECSNNNDKARDTYCIGDYLSQQRDKQVRKNQYCCCGKAHADTIDSGRCNRQSRTHTNNLNECRVFIDNAVFDNFNRVSQ